jgi:hypothetical protein
MNIKKRFFYLIITAQNILYIRVFAWMNKNNFIQGTNQIPLILYIILTNYTVTFPTNRGSICSSNYNIHIFITETKS